ncbi:MAG TPA: DUF222 domain-containing protein [Nocardioidaceae bacterium]|nr:DUF222 domain-containing protein [Nocardioidaceae bacterium]
MCTKQAENPANVWGRLGDAVAAVAAIDSSALAGEAAGEQLLALRPLIDQLEAVFSGLAARFDASGAHEQAGARTAPAWLRRELRLGPGEARRTVALGRALPMLPGTSTALAAGEVGLAHAHVMASALEQLGATTMREAEAALLSVARLTDPAGLREAVKALREALDPDALERDYVNALGRRQVSCVPVGAGFHLSGFDAESGAIVATAIDARIRPSGPDDRRRIGERRADALADICRESLDAGTAAKDGGIRPHLSLTVDWSRFGGTSDGRPLPPACHLEGFGPIPDTLVRKLCCDAGVSRVVTDPDGAPLNLGRTARTAQPHQRRGIRARDRRRCRNPGMSQPKCADPPRQALDRRRRHRHRLDGLRPPTLSHPDPPRADQHRDPRWRSIHLPRPAPVGDGRVHPRSREHHPGVHPHAGQAARTERRACPIPEHGPRRPDPKTAPAQTVRSRWSWLVRRAPRR